MTNEHRGGSPPGDQAGTSCVSRKRKQPDSENDILQREGPLTEPPIDNEYEQLDDDDDEEADCARPTFNLKKADYRVIEEAQEKATISQYGDIKITPFNLEEELEDGEFDKAGNFLFKKKVSEDTDEEENDTWAESVNWADVERQEKERELQQKTDVEMKNHQSKPTVIKKDRVSAYKEMLRLMRPDEIVKKTIQRLGNDMPKRKPSNKNAKARGQQSSSSQPADVREARRKLDLMIELAHGRLEDGDIDIYQKSYEDLEEAIN